MKTFLSLGTLLVLTGGLALAGDGDGVEYSIKGKYYETCGCAVSCPCPSNATLPTEGHCDAISLFHIDDGKVGKTDMDGLNIAMVLMSPAGQKVMDSFEAKKMDHLVMYLDDRATPEQKEAMNTLLPALFGTDEIQGAKPPTYAPITLTVNGDMATMSIAGGQKLAAEIENIKVKSTKQGAEGKMERITISGAAPFPWVDKVTQGISKKFTYNDFGKKWEYKERNAFFAEIDAKGKFKPAAAPAAPAATPAAAAAPGAK